jgi:hypothetical protein
MFRLRRARLTENLDGAAFGCATPSPAGAPLTLHFLHSQVVDPEHTFVVSWNKGTYLPPSRLAHPADWEERYTAPAHHSVVVGFPSTGW